MKKILCAEGNPDIAEAVRIMLSGAGFNIEVAPSGKDCMQKIKANTFDLFLLDVKLPDMSGWDIFEELKSHNKTPNVALMSTIPITNERRNHLQEEGIDDYITKPFKKSDLIKRIKAILT